MLKIHLVDIAPEIETVRVFSHFKAARENYDIVRQDETESPNARRSATRSLIVTSIYKVLPTVKLQYWTLDETVPREEPTKGEKEACLKIGFAFVCHLAKPINTRNQDYINKRWATAQAMLLQNQKGVEISNFSLCPLILELLVAIPELGVIVPRSTVAQSILDFTEDPADPIRAALVSQMRLVYGYAGMVAIEQMARFIHDGNNLAISISSVLGDAERFQGLYAHIKEKAGPTWPFTRSLNPQLLTPLQSAKFPDLYAAANTAAVEIYGFKRENYLTSAHPTKTPIGIIRSRARMYVGAPSKLSKNTKARLHGANAEEMEKMISQKRRRQDEGDESDE